MRHLYRLMSAIGLMLTALIGALPAHATVQSQISLDPYIVRLHSQGAMQSCLSEALSTVLEIESAERGQRVWLSGGYVCGRLACDYTNGIVDADGFNVAVADGIPLLSAWGNDGQSVQAAPHLASPLSQRLKRYWTIDPSNRAAIVHEMHRGRPIVLIGPWSYGLEALRGSGLFTRDWGGYRFWHALVIVGSDAQGVWVLNDWPGWGSAQRAHLSWRYLRSPHWDGQSGTFARFKLMASYPRVRIHPKGQ